VGAVRAGRVAWVVAAALFAGRLAAADPAGPAWTLDPARLIPEKAHARPVFVYVGAPWSRDAAAFERDVLSSPRIVSFLDAEFLCARVDRPAPDDFAERYAPRHFPAFVFLDRYGARKLAPIDEEGRCSTDTDPRRLFLIRIDLVSVDPFFEILSKSLCVDPHLFGVTLEVRSL